MQLSYSAIQVLNGVLCSTGEKEIGDKGQELLSARRLNGAEASQRRFFVKEAQRIEDEVVGVLKPITEAYNAKLEEKRSALKTVCPKGEGEKDDVYEARILDLIGKDEELKKDFQAFVDKRKELFEKKNDLNLTDKTLDVCRKYFSEYGEKNGFAPSDDFAVEEIESVL